MMLSALSSDILVCISLKFLTLTDTGLTNNTISHKQSSHNFQHLAKIIVSGPTYASACWYILIEI